MAVQTGSIRMTGSIEGICFYKMNDQYFARTKSSLDGKRVKNDPAFRETMYHASLLARASKIVSPIYRELPASEKERKKYLQLVSKALGLLKQEKAEKEIQSELKKLTRQF